MENASRVGQTFQFGIGTLVMVSLLAPLLLWLNIRPYPVGVRVFPVTQVGPFAGLGDREYKMLGQGWPLKLWEYPDAPYEGTLVSYEQTIISNFFTNVLVGVGLLMITGMVSERLFYKRRPP